MDHSSQTTRLAVFHTQQASDLTDRQLGLYLELLTDTAGGEMRPLALEAARRLQTGQVSK
jgi:hypothetical protein